MKIAVSTEALERITAESILVACQRAQSLLPQDHAAAALYGIVEGYYTLWRGLGIPDENTPWWLMPESLIESTGRWVMAIAVAAGKPEALARATCASMGIDTGDDA